MASAEIHRSEMACVYSSLILLDENIEPDRVAALIKAAGVDVEMFWPNIFVDAVKGIDLNALVTNVSSAPVAVSAVAGSSASKEAEPKKEEKKVEEEDDMEDDDVDIGMMFG